jgi:hypothetical protein
MPKLEWPGIKLSLPARSKNIGHIQAVYVLLYQQRAE